jgi:hypothetical protein
MGHRERGPDPVGDVVRADQDHREIGLPGQRLLPLGDQPVRGGPDHRHAAQLDRPVQPLGEPGREQRARGLPGPVHPVPDGGRIAQHDQPDRRPVVLRPVCPVTGRRPAADPVDGVFGQPGLAEQQHRAKHPGHPETAAAIHGCGGHPLYPTHLHRSPIGRCG